MPTDKNVQTGQLVYIGPMGCGKSSHKNVQTGQLVYIGPMGCGKSSHINSLMSVQKGRIAHIATEGNFEQSTTTRFSQFMCGTVLVSDTMGIEENEDETKGITVKDIISLVKGHVPANYKFDPTKPIEKGSDDYKENPCNADKVHCVVLCVDAAMLTIKDMPKAIKNKIKRIQIELSEIGVPTMLLLTKIDTICSYVDKDISYTFKSKKVKDAVQMASEKFGISAKFIYPVRNFKDQANVTLHESILLLLAQKKAIEFAQDHIETLAKEQ